MKPIWIILIINIIYFNNISFTESTNSCFRVLGVEQDTSINNFRKKDFKKQKKANQLYDRLAYQKAISLYQELPFLTIREKSKLANAYRLTGDTKNAEKWYGQFIDHAEEPIDYLHYARILQSNNKLEQSAIYFRKYSDYRKGSDPTNSKEFSKRVLMPGRFNAEDIDLKNVADINSESYDFSPVVLDDKLIFVSTRPAINDGGNIDPWVDENYTSLFQTERRVTASDRIVSLFAEALTSAYHEGPSSFQNHGEIIYFTRSNLRNDERVNDKNGIMKLQIFSSHIEGDDWSDPVRLNFNLINSDNCHPSISSDGSRLYFASNRPGGYGGMDLYVTENRYGLWTNPKNLGPSINTPANEFFPFSYGDGALFFASDGWDGLGGLDIFYSEITDESRSDPINMGRPFNSEFDDFGLVLDSKGEEGYLSSNRKGGKGKDDIYSFKLVGTSLSVAGLDELLRNIQVHEAIMSFKKLPGIPIIKVISSAITHPPRISQSILRKSMQIPRVAEMLDELNDHGRILLKNIYYNLNQYSLSIQSKKELDNLIEILAINPDMRIELGSHTDSRGSSIYNKKLSSQRAEAAVAYIVGRGISPTRLKAQGYGETKLINRCIDGIRCFEEEHRINRRTEIKILKDEGK
ncbi:MAG: OmpA family protein [Bacteroidia bacterium]|nr:OmpA family protein [Bacteroidia bacterium]